MNRIEYINPEIDRSKWKCQDVPADEPDKVQWIDDETGLDCLIVRGPSGALCGYVGIPKESFFHGKNYNQVHDEADISVHGGLTFSDGCGHSDKPYKGVCHVPQNGRPDDVWWLGFDCAHSGDLCPSYDHYGASFSTYKGIGYVEHEVKALAKQLNDSPLRTS